VNTTLIEEDETRKREEVLRNAEKITTDIYFHK
jgi:hypothetical protein